MDNQIILVVCFKVDKKVAIKPIIKLLYIIKHKIILIIMHYKSRLLKCNLFVNTTVGSEAFSSSTWKYILTKRRIQMF
jgi:hypothetical protein